MKRNLFVLGIMVILAACMSDVRGIQISNEPAATPGPLFIPTATPIKLNYEEITVPAEDGLELTGRLYSPTEPPPWCGILLLHMIYGSSQDWGGFPELLARAGYAVLNLDMRGHGKTGGSIDWEQSKGDLQGVWKNLSERPGIDKTCIAVIGASMGANMALDMAAKNSEISAIILLSPGMNYYGVTAGDNILGYGSRPILILASNEDSYAAESSQKLQGMAKGEAELVMYTQPGHGTAMLQNEPQPGEKIIEWLNQNLKR